MTREDWARITDLFGEAIELAPEQRTTFLACLRADDPFAAAEIDSLLSQHDRPGDDFLPDFPE